MITYFSCVFLRKDLFVSVGNCIDIVNVILKVAIMIGIYYFILFRSDLRSFDFCHYVSSRIVCVTL